MKEIISQYTPTGFVPFTQDDKTVSSNEYKVNQFVRLKTYHVGVKKQRSLKQLGTLMACLTLFAENAREPRFDTLAKAKFACKVALDYRYEDRVAYRPDGTVVFEYRSFGYKGLDHMEACNVFTRAFDWMAGIMGITKEELIDNAKAKMGRR